ncbi:MAG: archaeal proteasome endopeptidase complex subunit alpha [Candidatus Nanohaloarchaeota archaeon QJJ-5]|nr:archaeal proteasome endopeptidase complex subunit alpha [Candidatus Nanohaloarchaeota archaeon QJJ-5]
MQLGNEKMQYDRAKTIFNPDGRLFQVEYARQAVKKGSTSIGLVYDNGVLLAATRETPQLQARNPEKVFEADNHAGVATSGLVADGRVLVDEARERAQENTMTYGEPIPINVLAKFLADRKQMFTQYGGVRPFGLAMLTGGLTDGEPELYQSDPSGILKEWHAVAIGRGEEEATKIFQEEYEDGLSEEDVIEMAVETLETVEDDIDIENIELALINDDGFQRVMPEDLKERGFDV